MFAASAPGAGALGLFSAPQSREFPSHDDCADFFQNPMQGHDPMSESGSLLTWSDILAEDASEPPAPPEPVSAAELASFLAGRMCHDFISPASAIVSGVDLLEDPAAADMREDAMKLIEASAKKLVALLAFSRVAFGGSSTAESFDVRELHKLTLGVFEHVRAELDWAVAPEQVSKPAARALLNLAQIGASALPTGGVARLAAERRGGALLMSMEAEGPRARLRPEALAGLKGEPLAEGLSGHWVQAYYLHALLKGAGGGVDSQIAENKVILRARCPDAA
jgi:histidine phosphotransferase ChpT